MTKFNTSNAKLYWPNLTAKTTQTYRFSTGPNFRVYIPALRLSVLPKLSIIKAAWKKLIDYGLSNYAVGHTSVGLTGRKASRVGKKMGGRRKEENRLQQRGKRGQEMFLGGVIDRLWSRAAWREAAWPQRWPWQLLGAPISPLGLLAFVQKSVVTSSLHYRSDAEANSCKIASKDGSLNPPQDLKKWLVNLTFHLTLLTFIPHLSWKIM